MSLAEGKAERVGTALNRLSSPPSRSTATRSGRAARRCRASTRWRRATGSRSDPADQDDAAEVDGAVAGRRVGHDELGRLLLQRQRGEAALHRGVEASLAGRGRRRPTALAARRAGAGPSRGDCGRGDGGRRDGGQREGVAERTHRGSEPVPGPAGNPFVARG